MEAMDELHRRILEVLNGHLISALDLAKLAGEPAVDVARAMGDLEVNGYVMAIQGRLGGSTGKQYQLTTAGRIALQPE
jgi:hypothetical protein